MTEHNNLYIWYEDIMQFVKVHTSALFTMQITSISSCGDNLMILANEHLFEASVQHKVTKLYQVESEYQERSMKKDIAQFLCSKLSIKRVPHLSNVKKIYCDVDGESFIAILAHVAIEVKDPEKVIYDFTKLLDECEFVESGIMDVTFEVKRQTFPANKFVVSSRCHHLRDLINQEASMLCKIQEDRVTPEMFNCILVWIYTNKLGDDELNKIFNSTNTEKANKKLARNFVSLCQDWKLDVVLNNISSSKFFCKFIQPPTTVKVNSFKWFSMETLPELYDITILLADNQQLEAHKVILMMRIEYFKMMFYHSWSESTKIDLRHVSINFMKPIIQFAYDNDASAFRKANYTENFMFNMCAILDQFLIEDVKNIFESMIMRKVNLKNCAENLEFSFMYNCELLKDFCMEFICVNISRLLEGSILDTLDIEIMKELSKFYKQYFNFDTDSSHIITPAFDAPTDEEIDKVIEGFDLSSYTEKLQQSMKKTAKNKNRLSKSELLKRNYEKEAIKNMKNDDEEQFVMEQMTPKTPDIDISGSWQKKKERKDSGKRKIPTAALCNEVMKNETIKREPMIDLKNLRNSWSEEVAEPTRSIITLADFGIKMKNKPVVIEDVKPQSLPTLEIKSAWNMDNVELKPHNQHESSSSDPFKSTQTKKKGSSPKPLSFVQKNFTSIVRDERKDKSIHEKIKTKSLILTQIEEKAIMELSEFYNIDNIFDEAIKIQRKVQKASQNLSQWQHQSNVV